MIVVKVRKNWIAVDGHAGYAEKGNDIVCAAVSALAQTLADSLDSFTDDRVVYDQCDGHMNFVFENLSERGELLVDSFFIGICGIANMHPECLAIK